MKRLRGFGGVALCCFGLSLVAAAQGGNDAGGPGPPVPVGQTSTTRLATLVFTTATTAGTPFTINVLTQGSPGLDFNFVSGGTCSTTATYAVGASCTVLYSFSPRYPGGRYGGVSLTIGTTALANTYIQGLGTGPEAALVPPSQPAVGGTLYTPNQSFAIDGAGDIFIGEFFGIGNSSLLIEIPSGCMASSCQQVVTTFADFANPNLNNVTIDGSGNLYLAFYGTAFAGPTGGSNVYELPRGCFQFSCAKQLGGDIIEPWAIVVDQSGSGNVYVTGAYSGTTTSQNSNYVIEIPPGCASVTCIVPISQPFEAALYNLQIDGSGNLYFNGPAPSSDPSSSGTYEIPAGCKSASCTITFAGIGGDTSTDAVDSAGNLYVAGYGGNVYGTTTKEFPVGCRDSSCALTVPPNTFQWYLPRGQLFNGNIYRVNDGGYAITEYDFADPATVTFPATIQGQVSPTQTVTLNNEGNQPLVFTVPSTGSNAAVTQYFNLDTTGSTACPSLTPSSFGTATLAAGANCTYPMDFAPVAPVLGTVNGTLTLQDNSLNVATSVQVVPLVGDSVLPGTTFMTLTASVPAIYLGASVTFTASVSSPSGTPTGTVTFTNGKTVLDTVPVDANGNATLATTSLPVGPQTVTATFNPTGIYLTSSASITETIYPAIAQATLGTIASPIASGTLVSLSATLVAVPSGATPTGTINFVVNGFTVGSAPIVNGVASLAPSTLPPGTDTVACFYLGDATYAAEGCLNTQTVTVSSVAASTALTLVPSANPVGAFAPFSLTTVLTANGAPLAGQQVTFDVDGMAIGIKTTNAQGTIVDSPGGSVQLSPGQHTISASYTGNASYAAATAMFIENVNLVPTTSTLTAPPSSAVYGASVTLSAVVAVNLTGSAQTAWANSGLLPTGMVSFYANGALLGTAAVSGVQVAQLTTTALPAGTDTITCSYSGDASFAASSCNSGSVTVSNPPDFSIAVTPGSQTVNRGDSATYTIALAGVNGAYTLPVSLAVSGLPTGATVSFAQSTVVPGVGPTSTTMTILTSPTQVMLRRGSGVFYGWMWLPVVLVGGVRRRLKRLPRGVSCGLLILMLLAGMGALSGCGGGYFGGQAVSHALTVTGTSGTVVHAAAGGLVVR
jgi:hypothetical protein